MLIKSRNTDFFDIAEPVTAMFKQFPATRYQGSKRRLLAPLEKVFGQFQPSTALDLYSGTATVSLLMRLLGWQVIANDYLAYNNLTARVMISSAEKHLRSETIRSDLKFLLLQAPLNAEPLVTKNFEGVYFTAEENLEIDRFCQNIESISSERRDLYTYAVGQALLMKRPYNLFHRRNLEMRTRNVVRSFGNVKTWNTPIADHAYKIIQSTLRFPFPTGAPKQSYATNVNTFNLSALPNSVDLIYLDPPYMNKTGLGVDYSNFYHFLEGLCDYRLFEQFDGRFPHRPISSKPSAWLKDASALDELSRVLKKWPRSKIVLSYRNDGRPTLDQIDEVFNRCGRQINGRDTHEFKYALSHADETRELILVSK